MALRGEIAAIRAGAGAADRAGYDHLEQLVALRGELAAVRAGAESAASRLGQQEDSLLKLVERVAALPVGASPAPAAGGGMSALEAGGLRGELAAVRASAESTVSRLAQQEVSLHELVERVTGLQLGESQAQVRDTEHFTALSGLKAEVASLKAGARPAAISVHQELPNIV